MTSPYEDAHRRISAAAEAGERQLDLSGVGLESLPADIGRLTRLTHLSLRNNFLTTLPDEIGDLVALQHLSLADNRLAALPEAIGRLANLVHLNLKNNALTTLPDGLLGLEKLESLQLAGNPLPLPARLVARWNRPGEILAYYREHGVPLPPPPLPPLDVLVARAFTGEALPLLWEELAVPAEEKPTGGEADLAAALVAYHVRYGLEEELRELFQILEPDIDWRASPVPETRER